jgi:hypothetical protein
MKITLAVEQTDGLKYQVTTNLFSIVALAVWSVGLSVCLLGRCLRVALSLIHI